MQTEVSPLIESGNNPTSTVPKKIKIESAHAASTEETPSSHPSASEAGARPSRKRAGSAEPTARKAASKKRPTSGVAKKSAAKKILKSSAMVGPSDADIRLRAYFIAERRVQLALQGDPAHDWLEAKQQLIQERRQRPT